MYNSITEETIKSIPNIGNIDIARLPQELTRIYADIISIRRDIENNTLFENESFKSRISMLRTLANNLETLTVNTLGIADRRSAAFVCGTARYLLLQIHSHSNKSKRTHELDRDRIPDSISAVILFLIGNSPADASEVSKFVERDLVNENVQIMLLRSIVHLAKGETAQILNLEIPEINYTNISEEQEALDYLWECLILGIKELAGELSFANHRRSELDFFAQVVSLSVFQHNFKDFEIVESGYPGPYHLARLLEILRDDLLLRGIVKIPSPINVDAHSWSYFLETVAKERPFLWENHYNAIKTNFLDSGTSSVLTFPTGAGKSTLAELKIASTILSGKSVLYLVPTHALEDQINSNLSATFSGIIPDGALEFDLEYSDMEDEALPKIAVMTPERCLTLISVKPEYFDEIGLIVFDEFHLIHGREEKKDRRSIDAMFCLLRLFAETPNADYMLISAMVENGKEISEWIASVTNRTCISFDSSWKPTRQLLSCIIYKEEEIKGLEDQLREARKSTTNKAPGKAIKENLLATPYTFFSLKNKWDTDKSNDYHIHNILNRQVNLTTSGWRISSNRNEIAADFAVYFASQNIKTLVFVDNPIIVKSTANKISARLAPVSFSKTEFVNNYQRFFEALQLELGDIKYAFVSDGKVAMHHGNMLPTERRLNEIYYKKGDGINVIVATATLAQGINLPAEVVIMAGDDRFDEESGFKETIDPHEILNAAGRAGRAGSSAQGIVLLIPGNLIRIEDTTISKKWWELKEKVFSNSDQCLQINDPLTGFLDNLTSNSKMLTVDQKNVVFRLSLDAGSVNSVNNIFGKSLGKFRAVMAKREKTYDQQIQKLLTLRKAVEGEDINEDWVDRVSLKMGLEPKIVIDVGNFIDDNGGIDGLDKLILDEIIELVVDWLCEKEDRIFNFFAGNSIRNQLSKALNIPLTTSTDSIIFEKLSGIKKIILAYINGATYESIEIMISGKTDDHLDKARNFCLKLMPNISFIFGVISLVIREQAVDNEMSPEDISYMLKALATFLREGLDSEDKLRYKSSNPYLLRTQVHAAFDIFS